MATISGLRIESVYIRHVVATLAIRRLGGPDTNADSYEVAFGPLDGGGEYRSSFSVSQWQLGHSAVQFAAEFFKEVPLLLTQGIPSARGHRIAFKESLGEYHFILENRCSKRSPHQLSLEVFAPTTQRTGPDGGPTFAWFAMFADADQFAQFGNDLYTETDVTKP